MLQNDLELLGRNFSIFVAESLTDSLKMIETFRRFLLIIIPASIFIVTLVGLWIANKSLEPINTLDSGILLPLNFKDISLNECLQQAIKLAMPLAEKRLVSIKTSLAQDIHIIGDKERITEAILKIIENAINYNKEKGGVEIATELIR